MSSNSLAPASIVDAKRARADVADGAAAKASCTVFALGLPGPIRPWFLGRAASLGNMMRTSDPATARTWPTVAELESWVEALPDSAKAQIADRELLILPLVIETLPAVGTFTLKTVETKDEAASHAVERRPDKTSKPTPLLV